MKSLKPNGAIAWAMVFFTVLAGTGGKLYAGGQKAAGSSASMPAGWPQELVMCYLPNEASEELAEFRSALQGELSAALGIKVREINAADYNAVVEAMRTKHADIVYYGPVSYVQAAERAGAEAITTPAIFGDKSRAGYTSKIIVKAGSPIRNLQDLRGKTFAFVDPASTSGNYVPTLELMNAFSGMTNEDFHTNGRFFSSVSFSGKHQNGLQGVINGDIDAAPVASDILAAEIAAGRAKESDFTVIHESPKIPSSPMAIRNDLPADLKAKVKQFLLNYKDPNYFQYMLGMSPADKPEFVEAFDRDYDYVRDLMAKVMPR
ncbi:MAG: phosphate/phosphite/phosphonate ABC transporter substrate-binding protein [Treponema sp.]|jgi:phosphonate transport system substrate-binding protein|nr:phosphate/phosphite/phosphonate ABC transporter substrate-binding protein [Treponema sp.]